MNAIEIFNPKRLDKMIIKYQKNVDKEWGYCYSFSNYTGYIVSNCQRKIVWHYKFDWEKYLCAFYILKKERGKWYWHKLMKHLKQRHKWCSFHCNNNNTIAYNLYKQYAKIKKQDDTITEFILS